MGFFDFLTSTKRPASGTPVLSPGEVVAKLMAVNRPTAPFRITDGKADNVDLIAEWKIVDAQWYEIFAKAGLEKVFRIHMKLEPAAHEVRTMDHEYSVEWRAGVPTMIAVSGFKGQSQEFEFGKAWAFTENFLPGQVYNYKFDTTEIKKPLQEAVAACGWTYRGVAFGKL